MLNNSNKKKYEQLGMPIGTASNRLVKDLLFDLVIQTGHKCCRCGMELDRDSFSIDHKIPWLDSADPVALFFDLKNVGFSHMKCNIAEGRRDRKYANEDEKVEAQRRLDRERKRRSYTTEKRREKFRKTGY